MKHTIDSLLLFAWAVPIALALSIMLGLHFSSVKKEPLAGLINSNNTASLQVHHFLSLQCKCSKNIVEHLIIRKEIMEANELVHLVHATPEIVGRLTAAGFKVETLDEEEAVQKFNLQALPQMVIMRGPKTLYQGGYGPDQQHRQIYEDDKIIASFVSSPNRNLASTDEQIKEFPIFGCANGKMRKHALDTFGLKYDYQ